MTQKRYYTIRHHLFRGERTLHARAYRIGRSLHDERLADQVRTGCVEIMAYPVKTDQVEAFIRLFFEGYRHERLLVNTIRQWIGFPEALPVILDTISRVMVVRPFDEDLKGIAQAFSYNILRTVTARLQREDQPESLEKFIHNMARIAYYSASNPSLVYEIGLMIHRYQGDQLRAILFKLGDFASMRGDDPEVVRRFAESLLI